MTPDSIGQFSLTVSSSLYTTWLLPQVIHNWRRRSVEGISLGFHAFLLLGCCFDLLYGFGLHMPWQYRWVSLMGLLVLSTQHMQWYRLAKTLARTTAARGLTLTCAGLLLLGFVTHWWPLSHASYDNFGMLANLSFLLYPLPQIMSQFRERSSQSISVIFIILSLFLNSLDLLSAYTLQWDWPSLLGPPLLIICNLLLLYQYYYYYRPIKQPIYG